MNQGSTIFSLINDLRFVSLANRLTLFTYTISDLYQNRWQIELFFKWIKQHLRIKSFYDASDAICYFKGAPA